MLNLASIKALIIQLKLLQDPNTITNDLRVFERSLIKSFSGIRTFFIYLL